MKKKILIGSIFAALILLSMPFVSTLQAAPAPLDKISIVENENNDDSLGSISVCIFQRTPTGVIGCPGIRVILRNNNQVVRIGKTNIAGGETFFGLEYSNEYTVVFSRPRLGRSTRPLGVDWNSVNGFRWEDLVFSEDESIENSARSIESMIWR